MARKMIKPQIVMLSTSNLFSCFTHKCVGSLLAGCTPKSLWKLQLPLLQCTHWIILALKQWFLAGPFWRIPNSTICSYTRYAKSSSPRKLLYWMSTWGLIRWCKESKFQLRSAKERLGRLPRRDELHRTWS